jgi:outer membrane lipoprotein-sorting protein
MGLSLIGYGMRGLRVSLFLFLLLFLSTEALSSEKVTIEVLKGIIQKRAFKTVKATFDLSLYKDGEPRGEFQGVSAFKAPNMVTFKIFGPFGLTILDLIGKEGILQIYVPPKDELYIGNLPKNSSLIFSVLDNSYLYAMEETEKSYILYLLRPDEGFLSISAKFFFDKIELKNREIDVLKDGKSQFRIEFNKFNNDFPLESTLFLPNGVFMIIKNKDVILDEPIPEELFSFKETEGREVKDIGRILEKMID